MTIGRRQTSGVIGSYWMSSNTSVAEHHGAGRRRDILAHLERLGVDLRRHAAVLDEVVDIVLASPTRGFRPPVSTSFFSAAGIGQTGRSSATARRRGCRRSA